MSILVYFKNSKILIYLIFGNFSLKKKKENIINVKLCIMLSHASKGHNLILMILYIFRVILNCTMTSLTLCCLGMTLPISLCYSSVVNKHQLLALSVLCLFAEFNKNKV